MELRGAQGWLADGHWPDNPYTGEPLLDTKSAEFDPDKSPGNIYYQRIFSAPPAEGYSEVASDRHQIGYVLHVFGADGQVWTYRSKVRLAAD